jgi:hypothetical protein
MAFVQKRLWRPERSITRRLSAANRINRFKLRAVAGGIIMTGIKGTPTAGWYRDPYGQPVLRWWDGARWSEQTHATPPPDSPWGAGGNSQTDGTTVRADAKPRKSRRVFLWFFLAVQGIFIIWLITGTTSSAHGIHPDVVRQCHEQANITSWGSVTACENALGRASKVGAALVVAVWVVVDFLLGITYGIYRLARRPR